jgi:3-hydroxyisobutyrate dehydrogenase-like beta-hydroxyacid dehydrogenase
MGKPMAMNLIKAGYRLTVWNRTPSKALELISDHSALILRLETLAAEARQTSRESQKR